MGAEQARPAPPPSSSEGSQKLAEMVSTLASPTSGNLLHQFDTQQVAKLFPVLQTSLKAAGISSTDFIFYLSQLVRNPRSPPPELLRAAPELLPPLIAVLTTENGPLSNAHVSMQMVRAMGLQDPVTQKQLLQKVAHFLGDKSDQAMQNFVQELSQFAQERGAIALLTRK